MSEGGNSSRQHRKRQQQTVGLKKSGLPVGFKRVRQAVALFPSGSSAKKKAKGAADAPVSEGASVLTAAQVFDAFMDLPKDKKCNCHGDGQIDRRPCLVQQRNNRRNVTLIDCQR
mmetsp:Transcript_37749/g.93860  ORF Transcript_37749/g.93860 Transcript_37749/m.93860 type:complete len:115 (-) Transcript_37749:801-1145(-)